MLTYDLGQRGKLSLYEYIYRRIRGDVESGVLAPNTRLPSKRALAGHLGVSVITVEGAYSQLLAEGYVRSEPRRGFYVNELPGRYFNESPGGEDGWAASKYGVDDGAAGGRSVEGTGGGHGLDGEAARRGEGKAVSKEQSCGEGRPLCGSWSDGEGPVGGGGRPASGAAGADSSIVGEAARSAAGVGEPDGGTPYGVGQYTDRSNGSGPGTSARGAARTKPSVSQPSTTGPSDSLSEANQAGSVANPPGGDLLADFSQASAASDDGAYRLWSRAVRATLSGESETSLFAQLPPKGARRLREAIAAHLRGQRGMTVDPSRIIVGAGAEYLYGLVVQILGRDRGYAIEDPGYPRLVSIYESNGARVRRVRLDGQGMDLAALGQSGAGVAHVMPSHQFPTGIVTSAARRHELLGWAAESRGFIVEDDYDCEFRLAGRPVPSLQSIDTLGAVLYLNTFSKSLSPALRVAYLVLPDELAQAFDRDFDFYSSTVATPTQLTLARILETGAYERHISRIKTRHRAIRDELIAALRSRDAAGRLRVENEDAGLHFVLAAATRRSEPEIAALALREGVRLAPLSGFAAGGGAGATGSGGIGAAAVGGSAGANSGLDFPKTQGQAQPSLARFVMRYGDLDVAKAPKVADVIMRAIG